MKRAPMPAGRRTASEGPSQGAKAPAGGVRRSVGNLQVQRWRAAQPSPAAAQNGADTVVVWEDNRASTAHKFSLWAQRLRF